MPTGPRVEHGLAAADAALKRLGRALQHAVVDVGQELTQILMSQCPSNKVTSKGLVRVVAATDALLTQSSLAMLPARREREREERERERERGERDGGRVRSTNHQGKINARRRSRATPSA